MKELVKDSVAENFRKSNFIRIYPTRTSNIYDKYFSQTKPINLLLHKCLFTDEVIPFPNGYPIELPEVLIASARAVKT